jgi:hypothetical protein
LRALLLSAVLSLTAVRVHSQEVAGLSGGDRVRVTQNVNGFLRVYDARLLRSEPARILVTRGRDTLTFLLADVERVETARVGLMSARRGIVGAFAGGAAGLVAGALIGGSTSKSDYGPLAGGFYGLLFGLAGGAVAGMVTPGTTWTTVYRR